MSQQPDDAPRPAQVCRALLAALEASEGRRRQRKRDQTPDAIGLGIKRRLLARVVQDDPDPAGFESWLLAYMAQDDEQSAGSGAAMARAVLDEWRMAHAMREFAQWLDSGAPSADAHPETGRPGDAAAGPDAGGPGPDPELRLRV